MNWKGALFALLTLGAIGYALRAPDTTNFPDNHLARIIFFHLPCAFLATGMILLSAWLGLRYLLTGEARLDSRGAAATELALLFSALTMATGVLFSRMEWGAWWQYDPRQTSFLIVLLLCCAAVALRSGILDEQKAAKATAAYNLATFLPQLFLIFVLPRVLESFHPSNTIVTGSMGGAYWIGVLWVFALLVWAARVVYVERAALSDKRYELANSPDSAGVAGAHPRRPVALPRVGQEEDR